jgi:tetratricopeptide (TPR) repeat protein
VAVLAGLFTAWFEREIIGAQGADFTLSFVDRVLLAGRVIWFYLGKLIWPADLMFWYPRWVIDASAAWQYLYPAAAVCLAIGFAILARRRRGPLAAFLYFCGTLFPVLGFFDVYPFRFSYVADHFQYLASIGIIVPIAAGLAMLADANGSLVQRRIGQAASVLLVAALGVMTFHQSAMYHDNETLLRTSIARNPAAWIAYQNLGTLLIEDESRIDEAIDAYKSALAIRPDYFEARNNLVMAHIKAGTILSKTPEGEGAAIAHLEDALRIDPQSAEAHYVLANIFAQSPMRERLSEAVAHYEAALRARPNHFRARYNLGTVLMDMPDRRADAIAHLKEALKIQPDSVEANVNLGVLLAGIPGRTAEALDYLDRALAKRPDLAPIRELAARLRAESLPAGRP